MTANADDSVAALDLNYLSEIDEAHKARGEFQGSRGQLPRAAFDRLVLPDEHKRLIQSLVAQHFRDKENWTAKDEQLDIVRGKGEYLVNVDVFECLYSTYRQGPDCLTSRRSWSWENVNCRCVISKSLIFLDQRI